MKKGTLPNVLGIGIMKAGTSWLYDVLKTHPDVFMPAYKKEIHFFDHNFNKGIEWYSKFFPEKDTKNYKVIGEVTPTYLDNRNVPKRVMSVLEDCKMLVVLRNPSDRAFSHYRYKTARGKFSGSFRELIDIDTNFIEVGYYHKHLRNWLSVFPKEKFNVIIFEEMIADPINTIKELSDFLEIDFEMFDENVFKKKSNETFDIRFKSVYSVIQQLGEKMRSWNIDRPVIAVKKSGIINLFKSKKKVKVSDDDLAVKRELIEVYSRDVELLEKLLDRDLNIWR